MKRNTRDICKALRQAALFLTSDDYSLSTDEACRIALILAELAGVLGTIDEVDRQAGRV